MVLRWSIQSLTPEIYERAISAIELAPSECLVVEDSLNGLIAGDRAGTKLCAVLGTIEKESLRHLLPISSILTQKFSSKIYK